MCADILTTPWVDMYELESFFEKGSVKRFYSKNLLEHLGDPLTHLRSVSEVLSVGGVYECITDNALFFPFYMKSLSFLNVGFKYGMFGSHAGAKFNTECGRHFAIYTVSHLRNLFDEAGLVVRKVEYGLFQFGYERFARLSLLCPRIRIVGVKLDG